MFIVFKYALTAFLIVAVSEVAKKSGQAGALISSLPMVTVLVMIWLHVERQDVRKIADHAYYTFWYVIPTLPMFLVMPWLLSRGVNFWAALAVCVAVTFACFVVTAAVGRRFGVNLIP